MRDKTYFVYILASPGQTLYIGVTNDLRRRVYEHKQKLTDSFTKKYNTQHLVYYETTNDVRSAIQREKRLKWWPRKWKFKLIDAHNPEWRDLSEDWFTDEILDTPHSEPNTASSDDPRSGNPE